MSRLNGAWLATGESYREIHRAISDPGFYCPRRVRGGVFDGLDENLADWQTRAVMEVLGQRLPETTVTAAERERSTWPYRSISDEVAR